MLFTNPKYPKHTRLAFSFQVRTRESGHPGIPCALLDHVSRRNSVRVGQSIPSSWASRIAEFRTCQHSTNRASDLNQ